MPRQQKSALGSCCQEATASLLDGVTCKWDHSHYAFSCATRMSIRSLSLSLSRMQRLLCSILVPIRAKNLLPFVFCESENWSTEKDTRGEMAFCLLLFFLPIKISGPFTVWILENFAKKLLASHRVSLFYKTAFLWPMIHPNSAGMRKWSQLVCPGELKEKGKRRAPKGATFLEVWRHNIERENLKNNEQNMNKLKIQL